MQISNGRPTFYQWDLNQKLYISDTTHNYIHFANEGDENALVVQVYEKDGRRMVDVPNILLQSGKKIIAFMCLSDDEEFHTHNLFKFKVKSRPKPADYVYTETEVLNYNTIMDKLNDITVDNGGSYEKLTDLPSINGNTVLGDMKGEDLGLENEMDEMSAAEIIEMWNKTMNN
ncbi:MAG: hypothetical protein NC215_00235 [Ruminococcus sp.]|nr:hypothetical protein [Ruminococcus sp.]